MNHFFFGIVRLLACFLVFLVSPLHAQQQAQQQSHQQWTYTYNALGLIESEDGPRTDVDDITRYDYDSAGNKITMTNALDHVTYYLDYDARGNVGRTVDPNGVETVFSYHPRGWLSSATVKHPDHSSLDATTRYEYNGASGLMTRIILPSGNEINYQYDAARRLIATENNAGERIAYTLDAAGNRIQEVISVNGEVVRKIIRAYDELNRLMSISGNHGQQTRFHYDSNDNNTTQQDGRLNLTQQHYDALNRVRKITRADSGEVQFIYDAQDRVISVTDPRGITTSYSYDAQDNVLSEHSPDRGTLIYSYDEAGNRISMTDARGVTASYRYDALNRLTEVIFNNDIGHPENMRFSYDDSSNGNFGIGRLTAFSDESGSTQLRYNHMGLLVEKQYDIKGQLFTQEWYYDKAGNLIGEKYPSGRIFSYELDTQGRIIAIHMQQAINSTAQTLIRHIGWQAFGGITSIAYNNGITVEYDYDLDGRITHILATGAGPLQERFYHYDLADNITGIDDDTDAQHDQYFIMDELNRLVTGIGSYGEKQYAYDSASNRTALNWLNQENQLYYYDNNSNRLLMRSNTDYQYDPTGNVIATGELAFTYNAHNRLVSASRAGKQIAEYQHNLLGQRVSKHLFSENGTTQNTTNQTTTNTQQPVANNTGGSFLERLLRRLIALVISIIEQLFPQIDNGNNNDNNESLMLFSYNQNDLLSGEYLDNGKPVREYLYLGFMPVIMIEGSDDQTQISYYLNDHLGTPQMLLNQQQQIRWHAHYTPFGQANIVEAQSTQPLRFPGQYFDEETELHYNYFRSYDPKTGRYIQSDPIGLDGGLNTYGYVGGNPLLFIDQYGLMIGGRGFASGFRFPNSFGPHCGSGANAAFIYDGGFTEACKAHDICYSTCGKSKLQCDQEFYANGAKVYA